MGIDPKYFLDDMSPAGFQLASEGFLERSQSEWERTRILAYNSISPYLKKKISMEEYMPFLWDKKKSSPKLTDKVKTQKLLKASTQFSNLGQEN